MQIVFKAAVQTSRYHFCPFWISVHALLQLLNVFLPKKKIKKKFQKVTSRQIAKFRLLLLFWCCCSQWIYGCYCCCCPFRLSSGCPRWRLCVYLSCNMRSSGCSEPESISPRISTTDSSPLTRSLAPPTATTPPSPSPSYSHVRPQPLRCRDVNEALPHLFT